MAAPRTPQSSTYTLEPPRVLCDLSSSRAPTGPCDCACADDHPAQMLPVADRLLSTVRYSHALGQSLHPVSPEHCGLLNPFSPAGLLVLNTTARYVFDAFHAPATFEEAVQSLPHLPPNDVYWAVGQLVNLQALVPESMPAAVKIAPPTILTAWLHTTNACNLRCPYCYLDKTNQAMSPEIGRQSVDAVFRSAVKHGFSGVKLKYAGGEATLNFGLVPLLHDYAAQLAQQHQMSLSEVVLSNGVRITDEIIRVLTDYHINLMISLDGIGAYHDAVRPRVNGGGSFAAVSHNIERLLDAGITPDISITLSERNVDGLPETINYVLERDLPFSINFYRENDCSASFTDLKFGEQRIIEGMRKAFAVIEANLPHRSLLGSLVDRANFLTPHQHTCGVGRNYMVIDQHGHIAKCQMEITKSVTDIHAPDPLQLIRDDQLGIQNVSVDEKEGCRDCAWKYWCAGGCSLATFRATGRYDVKSPNCNIYRALYPAVLRLEGLRLIKYQNQLLPT